MNDFDSQFADSRPHDYVSEKDFSEGAKIKLLLTEGEAAQALGISRRTLWTLRSSGKIPFLRIGKCVRYSLVALQDWINKQNDLDRKKLPE